MNILKAIKKEDRNKTNIISSTTAKVAILLEQGFSSFSSQGGRTDIKLEDYLPFRNEIETEVILDQDTVDIYKECVRDKVIPDHVAKIFNEDNKIKEILKQG